MSYIRNMKLWAVSLATLLVLAACGGAEEEPVSATEAPATDAEATTPATESPAEEPEELYIVASTTILGDLVKGIVGDDATVEVLLPIGADPHDFQASSRDGVKIREADLVVANGLGLEESLIALFDGARDDGANILEVGELVDPREWGEGQGGHDEEEGDHDEEEGHHDEEEMEEEEEGHHDEEEMEEEEEGHHDEEEMEEEEEGHHEEEEGDHDEEEGDHDEEEGHHDEEGGHAHGGAFDPHFWFDPSRVERAVGLIAAELAHIGKVLTADEWIQRGEDYAGVIRDAAHEAESILSAVPESHRKLVTNHDSFSYFGEYFDFEVLDTILSGGTTLAQPGTAHLAELVESIREEGVPAIFTETTADSGLPNTVAAEFDPPLKVVELYTGSLGPEGSGAETYPEWLVSNARAIAEALTP